MQQWLSSDFISFWYLCSQGKKKSHFLGDLLINAKLEGILSLSSLPFVTNWSGGVQCTGLQQRIWRTACSNTAICAFLACLWEPTAQQRRWMQCEVLSRPFIHPGGEQKGGAASSLSAVLFDATLLTWGVVEKPAQAVPVTNAVCRARDNSFSLQMIPSYCSHAVY